MQHDEGFDAKAVLHVHAGVDGLNVQCDSRHPLATHPATATRAP
jgi:hypothetical protein